MALHLKYRPKTWEEIIGNQSVIDSLQAVLNKPDHPHFYLISGERGTGKTTIARLIAKTLDIENVEEINAASSNGVDFARDLDSRITYKAFGKSKLYIIDECHRLTGDAQDILLKTVLEDTPDHAYVIFLTTDPDKIKKAVLSRATKYALTKPTRKELRTLLQDIANKESIEVDHAILSRIIMNAGLIPRDSITELGKLVGASVPQQQELISDATKAETQLIDLARLLLYESWNTVVSKVDLQSLSADSVVAFLRSYMTKVLLSNTSSTRDKAYRILYAMNSYQFGSGTPGLVLGLYMATKEK